MAESFETTRGTLVEFYEDSQFGMVCQMNGIIQSATSDEKVYHKFFSNLSLVSPLDKKDISALIIGSGEGCLARELLAHNTIKHITMVDWDEDIVDTFRNSPYVDKWGGKDTWSDSRLNVVIADAWEWIKTARAKYDIILIDLFDPSKTSEGLCEWEKLLVGTRNLLNVGGTIVVYCGMSGEDVYQETKEFLDCGEFWRGIKISDDNFCKLFSNISKHQVHVPSFEGEAMFLNASGYLPVC